MDQFRVNIPNLDSHRLAAIITSFTTTTNQMLLAIELYMNDHKRIDYGSPFLRHHIRHLTIFTLIKESDTHCRENTRMDKRTFSILCSLLKTVGGLEGTEVVDVEEMVAIVLHIFAHNVKNRVMQRQFRRSGETVSRHVQSVIEAIRRLHPIFLRKPEPVPSECTDYRWKLFENCLGALDGTYIRVRVNAADRPKYRTRKGEIATNVLAVCDTKGEFTFVYPGWEGSAADSCILRDAVHRPNGLKVPKGQYYLVDAGYPNAEGFLAPYRGERYHLTEWRGGNPPTTAREFFNMKHSSARNVIERAFGLLKSRWAILREKSYYPVEVQTSIIICCCILNNLIKREMNDDGDIVIDTDEVDSASGSVDEHINYIETSNEWTQFRDNLASRGFEEWVLRRH